MTKNEIAKNINHTADIARIISVNYELDLEEGQIYNNRGLTESWSDRSRSAQAFEPLVEGIDYVFYANNVPCYLVDYTNKVITDILGATDCESEGEVLVRDDAVFEITYVSTEDDCKEMGYYTVELEFIGFREEMEIVA